MPKKDIKKYLFDVLIAIEGIESFANGFTISHLEVIHNKWALERGISIIGEALCNIRKQNPEILITDIHAIIDTRNIMVHDYDIVDSIRLLVFITKHIPILKSEVSTILESLS
jgi:uncharacterized protein with HEPN domain